MNESRDDGSAVDGEVCRRAMSGPAAPGLGGFVPCGLHGLFMNAIPLPVFVKDVEGRYVDCNMAFESFVGRGRPEIIGKTVFDMAPRDVAETYMAKDAELFASPGTQVYEWLVVRKSGERRRVVFHKSTIQAGDGSVLGLVGVVQDDTERQAAANALQCALDELELRVKERTEELHQANVSLSRSLEVRKRTEDALRESEERSRRIVESAPLGMHFYELTAKGALLFTGANQAADRILGIDNGKLVGLPLEQAFPPLAGTEIPVRYRDVALNGGVCRMDQIDYADELIRGAFEVIAFRVGPRRIAVIFQDITERLRTRRALEERTRQLVESEQKYRTVADFTYDWEDWRGPDGRFRYVSPACERITGYTVAEFMDNPSLLEEVLIVPEDIPVWRAHKERAFHPDAPPDGVYYCIRARSGETRWIHRVCQSVFDADGNWLGRRGTNRDDTQRRLSEERDRRLREEFLKADKMIALGTLVAGVAHEVNNPNQFLTLNLPIVEALLNKALPELDRRLEAEGDFYVGKARYSDLRVRVPDLVSGMRKGADRIKRIVEELKLFARDEKPTLAQEVDLAEVARSAVALMNSMIRKHCSCFSMELSPDTPRVRGSFQRIEQVAINLLQNACLALPDTAHAIKVTVGPADGGDSAQLAIQDAGVGMTPDVIRQLGNPFFTTRLEKGGTGLGIAVSKRIVEEHGGTMVFESELDKGTTVFVRIPTQAGASKGVSRADAKREPGTGKGGVL